MTALLVAMLSGCATFRSYDKELGQALDQVSGGNVDGAIRVLESNNKSKNKDLLYYLELGELQRLKERYQESQQSWMVANERVQAWERLMWTYQQAIPGGPPGAKWRLMERVFEFPASAG